MLKNYFTIAWRSLWKNKTFTALNLGALAVSVAACLVIYFWIHNELSYDTSGSNADRVFRVGLVIHANNQPDKPYAGTAGPLMPTILKDFPEIEKAVRIDQANPLISYNQQHFFANKFFYADAAFFEVFGYPLVKGDPQTALNNTNTAVITESMAKKIFGTKEPIGQIITMNDTIPLTVSGVAKDLPANNHFNFDIITSMKVLESQLGPNLMGSWWFDVFHTYILLKNPDNAVALNTKIADIIEKYNARQNKEIGLTGTHFLQPLKSIHLHSDLQDELKPNGSIQSLRILGWIAGFLLLVACINYVNLTTATSFKRAKEIGVKKVAGASFSQLMMQFLSEAILISFIATALALALALTLMPAFNQLAGTQINAGAEISLQFVAGMFVFSILLGIAAGFFPSFYLSRIRPLIIIRKTFLKPGAAFSLRKVLVVFQFSITVALIIATIVAWQQLHYMQSRDLGFNKEQLLNITLHDRSEREKRELIKKEFTTVAGITDVCALQSTPGGNQIAMNMVRPEDVPKDRMQTMACLFIDFDFTRTYQLKMAAGRSFSAEYGNDSSGYILNEAAVREFGWGKPENAIGKNFFWGDLEGKIIGVVKDFHFNSLQTTVQPMLMLMQPEWFWYNNISVRIPTQNIKTTMQSLEAAWKRAVPNHPFEYSFVDEQFNKLYKTEQQLSSLSVIFSALIIFISCLGLLGLTMVAVSQRTKEIGVRKVLGASVANVTALLSKDFVKLVLIAVIIASPAAWWLMNNWLEDFAYRIHIQWWIFFATGLLAVVIALATISFQAIKAALANPVKSLRTE
jgi:putative ABC transport system permease protein